MDSRRIKDMILAASDKEIELIWLAKIVHNQTGDEFIKGISDKDNGIGLNKRDAPILTSYYKQVLDGKGLTGNQVAICKKCLPKYWRQYVRMMDNGKQKQV